MPKAVNSHTKRTTRMVLILFTKHFTAICALRVYVFILSTSGVRRKSGYTILVLFRSMSSTKAKKKDESSPASKAERGTPLNKYGVYSSEMCSNVRFGNNEKSCEI